jgi:hypothetical protein
MTTNTTTRFSIGSVSHGTLKGEDLLPVFADELKKFEPDHELVKEAYELMAGWGDNDNEEMDEIDELVNDIQDAIGEFAAPFTYFGAHEGDGSDFGWWIDTYALDEARHDSVPVSIDNNYYDFLPDYGLLVDVNDHGNVTLYTMELGREIWAVV